MFQYVITNVKPLVRSDTMEGRDWLVGPMIMITEGVHNGSDGPIFYPAEELQKSLATWNHRPVVVYHPERQGQKISACDPIELTSRKIGLTMNTTYDDKDRLVRGEAWMEPDRIAAVDSRVADAVENERMMELSTGLFMDLDRQEGEWSGEKYIGIAKNVHLDHLAILPDLKGACSIADGAGFLRLNEAGDDYLIFEDNVETTEDYIHVPVKDKGLFRDDTFKTIWISKSKGIKAVIAKLKKPPKGQEGSTVVQKYLFVKEKWTVEDATAWVKEHKTTANIWSLILNEVGYDAMRRQLNGMLREKKKDVDAWIEEVFDGFFVYEQGGKLYRQDYELDDGQVKFVGLPKQVERQVTYKDVKAMQAAQNAEWTTKYINDLADSAFLYVEPGGKKDDEGKTVPRSLRHFPFKDAGGKVDLPHLRNALARIPQSKLPADVKKRCTARAQSILAKSKTNNTLKGNNMEKEQIVNLLIESERTPWKEDERDELMAMNEKVLEQLTLVTKEPENKQETVDKKPADNAQTQPQTVEQYVANAPPQIGEYLRAGVAALKREKDMLVKVVMANERNTFTAENLQAKPVEELIALARLAAPEKKTEPSPLYIGQGDIPDDSNQHVEEPLGIPAMNFEKAA